MAKQDAKEKFAPGTPFQKGHDPRRGHGVKGRSGRKPDGFKDLARSILNDKKTLEAVRKVAQDPENRGFATIVKMLAGYAEGLPAQRVKLSTDEEAPLTIRVVHE